MSMRLFGFHASSVRHSCPGLDLVGRPRETVTGAYPGLAGPHWRFLAETSGLLDRSLDYDETLENLLEALVPRVADYAFVAISDVDGAPSRERSRHRGAAHAGVLARLSHYWPQLETRNPRLSAVLRSERLHLIECARESSLSSLVDDPALLALLAEFELVSMIFIPLVVHHRHFGCLVIATTHDSQRRYVQRDLTIASELGRRAALAIDHAVLYRQSEQAAHARETMMALVSHDLRNPLSTIQFAARFLLDELTPNDEAHGAHRTQIEVIHRTAYRMDQLVHDLLDASAVDAGKLPISRKPVAVDELMADAFELLQPLARAKGIALLCDRAPALPAVSADRERVLQIFSNLGGNAIKHTPPGGRVDVMAELGDRVVEFSVTDTGVGIAAQDLPYVFDRFWQANHGARGGVGLGLAIVKGIIDAHEGEVRVESVVGKGTRFRFTLPCAP